jgi:DNA polymerase-3 subunit epsilon
MVPTPAPQGRTVSALPLPPADRPFVAIDFETADPGPDSACAVGLVRVEGGRVVARQAALIRPPRSWVRFAHVHGLTWAKLKDAPPFADVWPAVAHLLDGAGALVAHNAPFDRRVLQACCQAAGLPVPPQPFVCTVQLSRRRWGLRPNDLPAVCRRLGIGLIHHDAGSDAEAAARIVLAAVAPPIG